MAYDQANPYEPPQRRQLDEYSYLPGAGEVGPAMQYQHMNRYASSSGIPIGSQGDIITRSHSSQEHRRAPLQTEVPALGVSRSQASIERLENGIRNINVRSPSDRGRGASGPNLPYAATSDVPFTNRLHTSSNRGLSNREWEMSHHRGMHPSSSSSGREGHPLPAPGRQLTRQQTWNDPSPRQQVLNEDIYGQRSNQDLQPQPGALQRSMTMPTSVSQPQQYTAYNPAKHGGDQPNEANSSYARRIPESQWPRESVGAVLDAYYNEPEYLEYYAGNDNFKGASYEGPSSSHLDGGHKPNFSRPVLDNRQPPKEPIDPYWSGSLPPPTTDFQEAHPSRSHPHIRAAGGDGVLYDGATELSAEVPAFANSDRSEDSLPTHPSPSSMREYSSPNRLPAHPPPIRPGLLKSSSRGHPAPQRQYDIVRTSPDTIPASESTPLTVAELEKLSNAAKMNPGDHKLQLTLAKKMVEAATVLASEDGRADVKTTRKNRENYIYDAHKIIKRLTTSSHPYPDAVFFLASCYGEGQLGLQIDHERAYTLYQSAAKLNHGASAYRTAVCCELGAGIRKDPVKAMTWYKKAASLGETPAMFKLGMIQWKGLLGQPRNPRDGIIWLKRAADQADENNQHALHELGLLYERADSNDVIIPDHNYARELFMRAADLGYPASQFRMGCAYEYGTMGCPIDPKKSIAWYSKAAMKGDLESQLALSGWYLTGSDGVIQQSDTEAYLWARKAAEKGLAKAEYALGYFTEVGIGVPGNLDEAKRWYYKAASQQHPKAQLRLQELKKGGVAVQKSRERLSRSNPKHKEDGDCAIM